MYSKLFLSPPLNCFLENLLQITKCYDVVNMVGTIEYHKNIYKLL